MTNAHAIWDKETDKINTITGAKVFLVDHGAVDVADDMIAKIRDMDQQTFAALPGYNLLEFWYDPDLWEPNAQDPYEPYVSTQPIIGWSRTVHGGVEPLCLDMHFEGLRGNHGIQVPDGRVFTFEVQYSGRREWQVEQQKSAEREIQRKAGKAVPTGAG